MNFTLLPQSANKLWDQFVQNHPQGNVHQLSTWGKFQASIPYRGHYWIATLQEKEKIVAGTLIVRQKLPKGYCWLYAPRGPLLDYSNPGRAQKQLQKLTKGLKNLTQEQKAVFLRIDPALTTDQPLFQPEDYRDTTHGFQPQCTLEIDLQPPEKEILAQMKQKGRYNIKQARKKGVTIRQSGIEKPESFNQDLDAFYRILEETTSRDGFSGHPSGYYKNMLQILGAKQLASLYLAEYDGQVIAGLIATFFQDTAIYYYGASSNSYRKMMAPYLLQWQAIHDAKERGCKNYDFLGIASSEDPKDPWHGITRFKTRFGGQKIHFQPAKEYSFKPFVHFLYLLYKKLRKK